MMDAKTREALEGSIAKWQAILAGTGTDRMSTNCPLCQLFYDEFDEEYNSDYRTLNCSGCPVRGHTKQTDCAGTPYEAWVKAGGRGKTADTPELKDLAQAELDFLVSLRPEEPK